MALPFPIPAPLPSPAPGAVPPEVSAAGALAHASRDQRALRILAKSIYRELRQGGLAKEDVMAVAGELLSLVAAEVKDKRAAANALPSPMKAAP